MRKWILNVCILAAVLIMAAAAYKIYDEYRQKNETELTRPAAVTEETALPEETTARQSSLDFDAIKQEAPRAVAWLAVPGTKVDYPVVRADDNQYFVSHSHTGEASRYGAIFLDYRNSPDFSDHYTIIYGHNMKNLTMFGSLRTLANQAGFDAVTTGTLHTPQGDFKLELFAFAVVNAYGEFYTNLAYGTLAEKQALLDKIYAKAKFSRPMEFLPEEQVLALSTCSAATGDARNIVFCKMSYLS